MRQSVRLCVVVALLLGGSSTTFAQTVTLAWDANTEPDIAGYVVAWGTREGSFTSSANVGNVTQWTLTNAIPNQRYYFTVQAYNAAGLFSDPAAYVSNNAIFVQTATAPLDDRPGIFWYQQTTGKLLTWHLNGIAVVDTRAVSLDRSTDPNWQVAGTGDLNGDGFSDLVWRHTTQGWLETWYLVNNQYAGTESLSISHVADTNWRLAGVGDVNADRFADLVWQHADGRLAVWFMRGSTVVSTGLLSLGVGANSRWQIATVGDVNRDGYADIIWQTTDGWLATWLLRGTSVLMTQYFSISRMVPEWRIRAAGYPDGSATPALTWRNTTTGDIALWYLDGPIVLYTFKTKPSRVDDPSWTIVGSR